jgi:hypothetical protein
MVRSDPLIRIEEVETKQGLFSFLKKVEVEVLFWLKCTLVDVSAFYLHKVHPYSTLSILSPLFFDCLVFLSLFHSNLFYQRHLPLRFSILRISLWKRGTLYSKTGVRSSTLQNQENNYSRYFQFNLLISEIAGK